MARRKRTIKSKKESNSSDETLVDLVQVSDGAQDFIERNQNLLFGALVGIVAIIGGYLAYQNFYVVPQQQEAVSSMWKAEDQFAKDSFALAINNPGEGYLGFADISSEYSAAGAKIAADYYAAVGYLNLGKYDAAIDYLDDIPAKGIIMPVMKNGLLGDAYSEKGEFDAAIDYYEKAANGSENEVLAPYYYLKLGALNEKQGNKAKANAAYKTIKDKYPNSSITRNIGKYISRTTS